MMDLNTLIERERAVLSGLKDFQKATVDRCFQLYQEGQKRVLVADEVGLGKTLVARGLIAKLARVAWEKNNARENGQAQFKVLYICSNASIANQNLQRLKIHDDVTLDGVSDARLSMQHLRLCEQENNRNTQSNFIHLIPLTPMTSFKLTSGSGNANERALILAVLERMPRFSPYKDQLESFFTRDAKIGFPIALDDMRNKVINCNEMTNGLYLAELHEALMAEMGDDIVMAILQNDVKAIAALRFIFAKISVARLQPDFVIMDEFQRFRELITASQETETGMLAKAFLEEAKTNTLLLSATPFKLYQTLEESAEIGIDEHYHEFFQLMRFLHLDEEESYSFKEAWRNYARQLRENTTAIDTILPLKSDVEKRMYDVMCRTERLLLNGNNEAVHEAKTNDIVSISDSDILSFVHASNLHDEITVPVDYVKSSPYLLSFMEDYQYKRAIENRKPKIKKSARKYLFIDRQKIHSYKQLETHNARLERLMKEVFAKDIHKLLWIPPSVPYYEPAGVWRGKDELSKILVFSAWEMVPRMIATMLSYECEHRTIGRMYNKEENKRGKGYFTEDDDKKRRRYPTPRLTDGRDRVLTKPNAILADIYNPLDYMGQTIGSIKRALKPKIESNLKELQEEYKLPERLKDSQLIDIYTHMAIGSPAICALRTFGGDLDNAERFAQGMANLFDKPEAIAAIESSRERSSEAYYLNVLRYCVAGNFAAMLDEYAHILNEKDPERLCDQMCEAIEVMTASYPVDTYSRYVGERRQRIRMRSHFAVAYFQTKIDSTTSQRKENLRVAFNSPFRPFVLATTSIGQEGLDFHQYTRKIMHWNLPHNPVDIEQREGRINRYKCLAIRQSLARDFEGMTFFEDVWEELFEQAEKMRSEKDPELIPFWSLDNGGSVKIERIVPLYPYSKDQAMYQRLLKILNLYRLTMGQPRQEELLEQLLRDVKNEEDLSKLFINLSPITRV